MTADELDLFGDPTAPCKVLSVLKCSVTGLACRCDKLVGHTDAHRCPACGMPFEAAPPPRARTTDPETSHEAAKRAKDSAARQRTKILQHLATHGPANGSHIDEALGWDAATASRRMCEILADGDVRLTGRTPLSTRGRASAEYEITDKGLAELRRRNLL